MQVFSCISHNLIVPLHQFCVSMSSKMDEKTIKLKGKTFRLSIPEERILQAVGRVAEMLTRDYSDRNPVFVIVLNGAFVFAADLLRQLRFDYEIAFTKLSSYQGDNSTGCITEQLPVMEQIEGRHVVIIEDMVDSGLTMQYLKEKLERRNPASVEICVLAIKPDKVTVPGLNVKYAGMEMGDAFVVGYGFDYDDLGRSYRDIYEINN